MPLLLPQAALETALVNALQAVAPTGLALLPSYCSRTLDGQPPPRMGQWFAAVWGDNKIDCGPMPSPGLDERFGAYVTLTVRFVKPFDQWVTHRDQLEAQVAAIKDLVHQDSWSNFIINAANVLAGFRAGNVGGSGLPIGFVEGLRFAGADPIQDVGPDWFHAHTDAADKNVGVAQRLRFTGARRVRATGTLR